MWRAGGQPLRNQTPQSHEVKTNRKPGTACGFPLFATAELLVCHDPWLAILDGADEKHHSAIRSKVKFCLVSVAASLLCNVMPPGSASSACSHRPSNRDYVFNHFPEQSAAEGSPYRLGKPGKNWQNW